MEFYRSIRKVKRGPVRGGVQDKSWLVAGGRSPVALASLARAQNPLDILPNNYHLVYENRLVRVIDVAYAAHERLPVHENSDKSTVYMYLTDSGPVRFSHVEQPPFTLIRPEEKGGTYRVSPGRLERREVENLGAALFQPNFPAPISRSKELWREVMRGLRFRRLASLRL